MVSEYPVRIYVNFSEKNYWNYRLDWKLVLCLLASWGCVWIILIKGVRSSGKASYFLAIFPYVGMGILLVRACTLEGYHFKEVNFIHYNNYLFTLIGAADGIIYFIKPQFNRLLDPTVSFFFQYKSHFLFTKSLAL